MEVQLNFKDFKRGPCPLKFNWGPPQLDFKCFKDFNAFKFL